MWYIKRIIFPNGHLWTWFCKAIYQQHAVDPKSINLRRLPITMIYKLVRKYDSFPHSYTSKLTNNELSNIWVFHNQIMWIINIYFNNLTNWRKLRQKHKLAVSEVTENIKISKFCTHTKLSITLPLLLVSFFSVRYETNWMSKERSW